MKRLPLRGRPCWPPSSKFFSGLNLSATPYRSIATADSSPSSSQHDSLATFLRYARRNALSPTSTTYVGTYYEYLCQASLARLGFALRRTGGRSDGGIDLLGTWTLPTTSLVTGPLRCVVQCKALKSKVGPNLVRELEGSFAAAPSGWRGEEVIGVLCAPRSASKGVRDAIRRSRRGLVWVMVEGNVENPSGGGGDGGEDGKGRVRQVVWNQKVSDLGGAGVEVGMAYFPSTSRTPTSSGGGRQDGEQLEMEKEVVLTWKGEVWEPPTLPAREIGG